MLLASVGVTILDLTFWCVISLFWAVEASSFMRGAEQAKVETIGKIIALQKELAAMQQKVEAQLKRTRR